MLDNPLSAAYRGCQAHLTQADFAMDTPRNPKATGIAWLGAGAAFLGAAAGGQKAFLGVGLAFVGLAIAVLLKSRKAG
jgi:hypothetical protein